MAMLNNQRVYIYLHWDKYGIWMSYLGIYDLFILIQ